MRLQKKSLVIENLQNTPAIQAMVTQKKLLLTRSEG